MKFRIPELILGALLAVAIFSMGMVFAPLQQSFDRAPKGTTSETSQQGSTTGDSHGLIGWLTKDAAGFFTLILGVVGSIQAILFFVQLKLMRTSLGPAEAAAKAAQAAAEHIPVVERAYIFIEVESVGVGPDEKTASLRMMLKNLGQTPGFPKRVFGRFHIDEPINEPPVYSNEFLLWDTQDIVLKKGGHARLTEPVTSVRSRARYFSACVEYEDIFGRHHTSHICIWLSPKTGSFGPAGLIGSDSWD